MKIWCTVLRKNGTYKTLPIKAGKETFELDKNQYDIRGYRIGKVLKIFTVLRALYIEGYPLPIVFDIDEEMKKAKLKIDSKAVKNVTNKKILNVFGEEELTRLERILVFASLISAGIGVLNTILILQLIGAFGI